MAGPKLTHMGINVTDLAKMEAFYTGILGMTVSDRGRSKRLGQDFIFMTSDPEIHHQVVMVAAREKGAPGNVNQISFTVASLDAVRDMYKRVTAAGIEASPIDHGNAWSVYFEDPEGNLIEVYHDSPFYVPQPHGRPFDILASNEEIVRETEAANAKEDGAMSREDWLAQIAERIAASG